MSMSTMIEQRAASQVIPTVCGVCAGRMEWRPPFAVCLECGQAVPARRSMMQEQPSTNVRPMSAGQLTAGGR